MGIAEAVAAHEAAIARLDALKAACREQCDDHEAAVAAIDPEARARAVVAHHVSTHGDDALLQVLKGGRMDRPPDGESGAFVDQAHVAEVARVGGLVAAGADAAVAAGADQEHVALLEAASAAHAAHGPALEAAYAELARTSRERVLAETGR